MASVNKAILIGNLGQDPEIRYAPSGQAVTTFRIATTEKWRDKDGQMQERTDWHNIVCWGRQAEIANEYLKKGRPVYIEGRIQNRSYDDKDGNKRYISEIVVQRLQFLGGKPEGTQAPKQETEQPSPDITTDDEDLPF
ncbi:MAG: single-stranded DNA-binding protein [candidate division Zixibacteria bacterium 4484_95]|nr:MAG: single-stranded DNA-binding protein [candidate division Zixibacteria bacterium 4484_95]RKX21096.1 MAG: single-stranded DNA-binding protein [candidate division Zixibacteria bacterium]